MSLPFKMYSLTFVLTPMAAPVLLQSLYVQSASFVAESVKNCLSKAHTDSLVTDILLMYVFVGIMIL